MSFNFCDFPQLPQINAEELSYYRPRPLSSTVIFPFDTV